ncbi:MAG TPA: cysteine-rich CWC family protein [Bacillus sp. (in: firmicutes)]|nr:cysteine-rich CWC family protein [Bacillus sp. (in: firmicutes)]
MKRETEQAKLCPICGKDNTCGNIAGKPHGSCWCSSEFFPTEIFDLLGPEQQGTSCICKDCLKGFVDGENKYTNGKG